MSLAQPKTPLSPRAPPLLSPPHVGRARSVSPSPAYLLPLLFSLPARAHMSVPSLSSSFQMPDPLSSVSPRRLRLCIWVRSSEPHPSRTLARDQALSPSSLEPSPPERSRTGPLSRSASSARHGFHRAFRGHRGHARPASAGPYLASPRTPWTLTLWSTRALATATPALPLFHRSVSGKPPATPGN
jgi:hypothetical protein